MVIVYFLIVKCFGLLIAVASLFNVKAAKWLNGRKNIFENLESALSAKDEKRIWFHCSSLGEFEQGKPVMEAIRNEYPEYKIVLTFFSPSGYEQKKNDAVADYVFYLPLDGPLNSKRFIEIVKPTAAFFVKYEFWHFYIYYLRKLKIPCYHFSCLFRPNQIYFKFYGRFYKNILQRITHLFVQNQASLALLYKYSIPHVSVSGDTRFDRVFENSLSPKKFEAIEQFIGNKKVLVAGSTWSEDEKLLAQLINNTNDYKFIIAPHEIDEQRIKELEDLIYKKTIRYSQIEGADLSNKDVLIINNVGMLSSLYQYATVTYIGGGFGVGIHNTLEAAVFGNPILFGPKYQKFQEAVDLVKQTGAFSISDYSQLKDCFDALNADEAVIAAINLKNKKYVESKKGATDIIMQYLRMNN